MQQTQLVSIITPSYNSSKFIKQTIESVLNQTHEHWEMIIVDDGSTDDSLEIIRRYVSQDQRIKLIMNHQNTGASKSRNRAIKEARGYYIAFLDSDDVWFPEKLRKQIEMMQSNNIFLGYSAYNIIDENGKEIGIFPITKRVSYKDLLKTSSIGTLTTIYNVQELGKFYFEDIGHEDYAMKLKILKQLDFAEGIQEPLAYYRIVQKSLSRNKLKAAKWQWYIYREIEKLSLVKSTYYFLHYIFYGLFKYREI